MGSNPSPASRLPHQGKGRHYCLDKSLEIRLLKKTWVERGGVKSGSRTPTQEEEEEETGGACYKTSPTTI